MHRRAQQSQLVVRLSDGHQCRSLARLGRFKTACGAQASNKTRHASKRQSRHELLPTLLPLVETEKPTGAASPLARPIETACQSQVQVSDVEMTCKSFRAVDLSRIRIQLVPNATTCCLFVLPGQVSIYWPGHSCG